MFSWCGWSRWRYHVWFLPCARLSLNVRSSVQIYNDHNLKCGPYTSGETAVLGQVYSAKIYFECFSNLIFRGSSYPNKMNHSLFKEQWLGPSALLCQIKPQGLRHSLDPRMITDTTKHTDPAIVPILTLPKSWRALCLTQQNITNRISQWNCEKAMFC